MQVDNDIVQVERMVLVELDSGTAQWLRSTPHLRFRPLCPTIVCIINVCIYVKLCMYVQFTLCV